MHLAYLAGLIDGEGCLGFTKSGTSLVPRLIITNTNFDLLEDLKKKFGGHINIVKRVKPNWKRAGHWTIQNMKAIDLVDSCYRYLRIKSNQALLFFAYASIMPGTGHKWSQDGFDARAWIINEMHSLNRKGVQICHS